MTHRHLSVRAAVSSRLRAAGVLLVCLATALPLVAAAGDDPDLVGTDAAAVSVVVAARAQVGDDYRWGGSGPDAWDCSGLTSVVWSTVGGVTDIPRTSAQQQQWAVPIPVEQLLPGDLVFFGAPVSHVGIYSSGGRIVDASSSRAGVVERPIWRTGVVRYGRVPRPGMTAVRPWTPPPPPALTPSRTSPAPTQQEPAPRGEPLVDAPAARAATPASTPPSTTASAPTASRTPTAKPTATRKPVTRPTARPAAKPTAKPTATRKPTARPGVRR